MRVRRLPLLWNIGYSNRDSFLLSICTAAFEDKVVVTEVAGTLTANPVPSGPRLAGGVDGASGLSAPASPCPIAAE